MELIYVYIDKYRTFEKCEITFSKRFDVTYDHGAHQLSIQENPEYRSIYPQHISNINGIFGKNASGKTSLLSLIGKRIEDRHRDREIFEERKKDAHKRIDIFSLEISEGVENLRYNSSYFLLYYLGKDDNENPLFIIETNAPEAYVNVFENAECLTKNREEMGRAIDYYIGKGWFAGVLKHQQGKNIFLRNTQDYPNPQNRIQDNISIIHFQNVGYLNKFQIPHSFEEERKICLERRTARLQGIFLEKQIKFLCEQMKRSASLAKPDTSQMAQGNFPTGMYRNQTYTLNIEFKYDDTSTYGLEDEMEIEKHERNHDDIVRDYRYFKLGIFQEWEKITLAFFYGYTWHLMTAYIYSQASRNDKIELLECLMVGKENAIDIETASYSKIKEYYRDKIKRILQSLRDEDLSIERFDDVALSLERFLREAIDHQITCRYEEEHLIIEFSKDSDWEGLDFFFKDVLDENMHKNMKQEDSITGGFFEIEIQWLSDGERENLALFTSIDEQITMGEKKDYKKYYVLMFDEIERSMHPDLCRRLVAELMEFLSQYPGKQFQIIIASHSPFIASDMLQENVVCLSRNGEKSEVKQMGDKPFAQNIHTILKSQFFLDSFLGEYACRCVNVMLKCFECTDGEMMIPILNEFLMSEDSMDSAKRISSLEDAKGLVDFMIKAIGEPLIRNELSRLWKLSQNQWEAKK